jgi:hypothetical protein
MSNHLADDSAAKRAWQAQVESARQRTCPLKGAVASEPESRIALVSGVPPKRIALNACDGPVCMMWASMNDDKGRPIGGNCGIMLGALAIMNFEITSRAKAKPQPPMQEPIEKEN